MMSFGQIAVVAQDLKSILRESVRFEPSIYGRTPKPRVFSVGSAVIVCVVNGQKSPVVDTATDALSPVLFNHDLSKFGVCSPSNSLRRFWIFLAPCFRMGAIPLSILIVMLDVIGVIAQAFTPCFFFRFQFFAHDGMLA